MEEISALYQFHVAGIRKIPLEFNTLGDVVHAETFIFEEVTKPTFERVKK